MNSVDPDPHDGVEDPTGETPALSPYRQVVNAVLDALREEESMTHEISQDLQDLLAAAAPPSADELGHALTEADPEPGKATEVADSAAP